MSAASLAIIGLANIAGSLGVGWLAQTYRMKYLLVWIYGIRAVAISFYLMAPHTALTFYVFAAVLGLTWLATVPPTAGLVGKLFGTRYLATLFGLTLLSHQIGGFFGAWLGGDGGRRERQLRLDVVCGHRARDRCRAGQPADTRSAAEARWQRQRKHDGGNLVEGERMSEKKAILVVGAGDATGGAIARRFAREGYIACVTRRQADKLAPLVARIEADGGKAHAFGSDARKEDEVIAAVRADRTRNRADRGRGIQHRRQRALPDRRNHGARVLQGVGNGLLRRLSRRARSGAG